MQMQPAFGDAQIHRNVAEATGPQQIEIGLFAVASGKWDTATATPPVVSP
jgi:hypothetical protein